MTTLLTIALIIGAALILMHLWTRRLTRMGAQSVPQPGQILPVNGGSIHYVEQGDPEKPTVVLIHGLTGQLQHFTYAMTDLLADDFHVIAVDRPGCGYSTRDHARLATLPEQARMVHEFLEAKGVSQAILVGHSLGGAVSLAMALDNPERVRALALLAPLTHRVPSTPAIFKALEIRTEWLRSLIANTIAVPLAKTTAPHVIGEAFAPEPAPSDFLNRAGGALGLRPSAYITGSQDLAGVDASIDAQSQRYHELKVGGGILYGAEDPILSPSQQGAPMVEYGLSFEQLENRGHMIPLTAPEACVEFVRRMANASQSPSKPANTAG
ncbi:alpha/beta fold hydrolase [Ruegeria arenilitoris]|uniref:alpha/beta fold hydrolase n=1 Tax=Ruegeria arenilitoris TaxID=1173585 RepID=UPI00147A6C39|nr:alpha/beta hydrolase [Ruegeria arenilitoris]